MKKRLLSLVTVFLLTLSLSQNVSVRAQVSIKIGDYVQLGKYYGKAILWRCVDIDENGPLMLSDKIICLKPFDASGDGTSASHDRGYSSQSGTNGYYRQENGSNYWADSNIRCWLNSSVSAGRVNWICGNPPDNDHVWSGYNDYSTESGFLRSFSSKELGAIKQVKQKSILDGYEYSAFPNIIDPDYHEYHYDIGKTVQNYDTAFSEMLTDRMFLPDVKQINAVYNNRSILGNDYYIGRPTSECVSRSEYKHSSLRAGSKWYYWLRTPDADYHYSSYVRYITSGGCVGNFYNASCGDIGIRPAFYLNSETVTFSGGDGTERSPYTVGSSASNWHTDVDAFVKAQADDESRLVTVAASVVSGNAENIVAFLAAYAENGELIDLRGENFQSEAPLAVKNIQFRVPLSAVSYKLMFWNNQMQPLTGVTSGELKHRVLQDCEFESGHDFAGGIDEIYTYTFDGECESVDMTFAQETEFDEIYIYDAKDNEIGVYYGNELSGQTVNIPGNTVKIRLISDGDAQGYGFKTESIVVNL